ncbi:hypothetical protein KJA14_00020 [Patescibacteria group bacterium]|nr:hypothetical protein [Patescibacteria group bacterium]
MKKKLLFLLILSVTLGTSFKVLALETTWPTSPLGTDLTDDSTLTDMVRYFYEWGIFVGGIAFFISLLIGGFLYLTSMGNPARMSEAKNRVFSALIGLVLLLCIYLILNTINPELTILTMPKLKPGALGAKIILYTGAAYTGDEFELELGEEVKDLGPEFGLAPGAGVAIGSVDFVVGPWAGKCVGYFYDQVDFGEPVEELKGDEPNFALIMPVVRSVQFKYFSEITSEPCTVVTFYDDIDCSGGSFAPASIPVDCDDFGAKTIKSIRIVGGCSIFLYDAAGCGTPVLTVGGDVSSNCDFPDIAKYDAGTDFQSVKIQDISF